MGRNLQDETQENHETKALKKHKNKQKRKLEEAEAEAEANLLDPKKEKKKKKNNNEKQLQFEEEEDKVGTLSNRSPEKPHKKKKNKEKQQQLEEEEEKVETLSNGSAENPQKKKKKHKKEGEIDGLSNGSAVKCDQNGEIVDGSVLKSGVIKEIGEDGVLVSGKDVDDAKYKPLKSFAGSGLPDEILECCKDFDKPSPIQSHSWPFLLDGRDFIGIAKTGSGKTLAFGIPAIMHVLNKQKSRKTKRVNPLCLVLSPTRELAQQISDVLCEAGKPSGVNSVCLYGGTSKGPQIAALKSGVEIVIGTPGRLKDLIEMGICHLKDVSFVVLDEADRMLDMGFEPKVCSILSQTSSTCQMVMFSGTWPLPVHQSGIHGFQPN